MRRANAPSKANRRAQMPGRLRLTCEALEDRRLLAVYLPDTFAADDSVPVATSFNFGEQVLFQGSSGSLQVGFGQSALANTYQGNDWIQRSADALVSLPVAGPVGTPELWQTSSLEGPIELHATWRTAAGNLIDVNADTWVAEQLPATGVASNPTGAALNLGRQILYIGTDHRLHLVATADRGGNWLAVDLHAIVGLTSSGNVDPAGGVAAIEVGDTEYYIARRTNGDLSVISLTDDVWSFQLLDSANVPGFVAPVAGLSGALQSISYNDDASVGWLFYHDANDAVRGLWLTEGGSWNTAQLSGSHVHGIPSAAFENASGQLSVAYFDTAGHVHLLQQRSPEWTNLDFQGANLITLPLAKLPATGFPALQAMGTIALTGGTLSVTAAPGGAADGSLGNSTAIVLQNDPSISQASGTFTLVNTVGSIVITAASDTTTDGVAGNNVTIILGSSAASTSASYNAGTNTITVNVSTGGASHINAIRSAINGLTEFNAVTTSGGSSTYNAADNGTFSNVLSGGVSGSTNASYNSATNVITVNAAAQATLANLASAIDGLIDFAASASSGAARYSHANNATYANVLNDVAGVDASTYNAAQPSLYVRPYAVGNSLPGLHIVYKDEANHIQNFQALGQGALQSVAGGYSPLFDVTAFLEGYRRDFGYGLVNAARAVAYALGSSTALTGGSATSWNLDLIHAPDAWTQATGVNTAVFVLDSGVDPNHLDPQTLSGVNASSSIGSDDNDGHGSALAGLIAAANDGSGITGVAYNARVVPIKVGDSSAESESSLVDGITAAANYALPGGYTAATRVVNMSLGYAFDTLNPEFVLTQLRDEMYARRNGPVFVVAAGNRDQDEPDLPARFNVGFGIVAGAVNASSQRWSPGGGTSKSVSAVNYLLAPGVDVAASTLVGSSGDNHHVANITGTAAAAAHISGVVALLLDANPALTPRQVESILIASADPITQVQIVVGPSYSPSSLYWA